MAYLNGHELFFGVTATVGGGSVIGTPQAAQGDPKSLTVTTFELGQTTTMALDFLAAIQPLWPWDAFDAQMWTLDFGQFRLRNKSSSNRLYFSRMDNGTDYNNFNLIAGTVTVIKGNDVILILAPVEAEGYICAITAGYMTDDEGTKYKCVFTALRSSTTDVRVHGGVDIGTAVVGFKGSTYYNSNWYRTTYRTDELAPLFIESEDMTYIADKILITRACVNLRKTGLYTVGDSDVYYGYTLALKDGG